MIGMSHKFTEGERKELKVEIGALDFCQGEDVYSLASRRLKLRKLEGEIEILSVRVSEQRNSLEEKRKELKRMDKLMKKGYK